MSCPPRFPLPPQPPPMLRHGTLPALPPDQQLDLSVVIVHRNTPDELRDCLAALERACRPLRCQVLLVDQGSPPALLEAIRRRFPWVELIEDRSDRGYAASNNLGLSRARGRYLLLLNADVVLPPDALDELVAWMDAHPRLGYAGPRLVLPDGTLDLACRRSFPTPVVSLYRLSGLARRFPRSPTLARYNLTYLPPDREGPVEGVAGAAMLVRRTAAEQAGLLDETYFMYGEDLDWAARLRAAGWPGWYLPRVTALHRKRSSSRRRPLKTTYEFYRAMAIFYRRHYAAGTPAPVTWLVLTAILVRGALAVLAARIAAGRQRR